MVVVGLTGGIACGKSTVAKMLGALGAVCFSADEDARAVLQNGSPVFDAVQQAFPQAFDETGKLVRAELGQIIYADVVARKRLEALMHPAITARMQNQIADARATNAADAVVVYETPLLYEAELESLFDVVVAVVAAPDVQAARLQERERYAGRDPLTASELAGRLAAQIPVMEKANRADTVIRTETSLAETEQAVGELWNRLRSFPR